jgi:hypothetical protein
MISRLRFTRAYHTTSKRYVRHLNARLPCIFDVVQSGQHGQGGVAVAREAALGIEPKPAAIRPTIYADALIECGVAIEFLSDQTAAR